ncbi:hypothetical protein [Ferriphaselus sp. R-1]|uniref:hypothetical protein n=1 Tax=Ferriphaselus sp. R-1 TaxID=1485544 RepID=UPI00055888C9|nr:hypothetical protein [Ferriphaselus sp. R-1]
MKRIKYYACLISAFVTGGIGSAWWHGDVRWLLGFFCAGVIISALTLMGADERIGTWHYVMVVVFSISILIIGWIGGFCG